MATHIDEKVKHDQGYHGWPLHANDTLAALHSREASAEQCEYPGVGEHADGGYRTKFGTTTTQYAPECG